MNNLLSITLIGLAAGMLGTGIGGIAAFFINNNSNRFMSFILEFSAGLMMAVVCFDLLPHALELGGLAYTIIGIIIGVCIIIYLDSILRIPSLNNNSSNNKCISSNSQCKKDRLLKIGILTMIGIVLHNFPEGTAIGSGFEASSKLGFNLSLVIAIHNIPEGLAMAMPLKIGGVGNFKVCIYTFMAGIPMGIGAFIGALLGEISPNVIAICLGFAGGAMLYIVFADLIPESKNIYTGRLSTIGNILGIILGIIISIGIN